MSICIVLRREVEVVLGHAGVHEGCLNQNRKYIEGGYLNEQQEYHNDFVFQWRNPSSVYSIYIDLDRVYL